MEEEGFCTRDDDFFENLLNPGHQTQDFPRLTYAESKKINFSTDLSVFCGLVGGFCSISNVRLYVALAARSLDCGPVTVDAATLYSKVEPSPSGHGTVGIGQGGQTHVSLGNTFNPI